jgi:predicted Rossmann fold flavoprotein
MFPITDRSETIIECLTKAAASAGVEIFRHAGVESATYVDGGFRLAVAGDRIMECEKLIVTTGGTRSKQGGPSIAAGFGHTLIDPVPSLFTFHIEDARLRGLAGLSVESARARVAGANLDETGPILITHWGLSGPVILRLSAWGARWMHGQNYEFVLHVNWGGGIDRDGALARLRTIREADAKRLVGGDPQFSVPARLWERLVEAGGIPAETRWAHVKRDQFLALADQLTAGEFHVRGKSMNKEEFVTSGGVSLREIDFRTMQSRKCDGLYFAGEVLDIDGITGGYNFQSAWTTGWIAGHAAAAKTPA